VDRLELKKQLKERRHRYFDDIRQAAGLDTMADLATTLGVAPSTLSNIQNANRAPGQDLISKIKKLAPQVNNEGIFSEEPEAALSIGGQLTKDYDQRLEALRKVVEDEDTNIENICRNFDALNKGDVFIYVSALTPPIEMEKPKETALHDAIANAIQREALFLYLMPTTQYLRNAENWNFLDIPALFTAFKDLVMSNISKEKQNQCRSRLLLIQADASPYFLLPDFKWELFYSEDLSRKAAADVLIYSGGQGEAVGPKIRIPLSDRSTKWILFEIVKTICLVNPNLPDRLPDDTIDRLVEGAESATGKKIQRG
jgi:transcriptional regulator with XRE-family HTH domain